MYVVQAQSLLSHCRVGIVSVTGNRVFLVEETINLTCSAQIPVRFLQWTDELNRVLITETQEQELSLTINAASANNSRYTCTAISNDGQLMESQTTTISVVGMLNNKPVKI